MSELQSARQKFIDAHNIHNKFNNPDGWDSGEVHIYWEKRTEALLEYVLVKAPFREIYKLIKARGAP